MIRMAQYGFVALLCFMGYPLFAFTVEDCILCHGSGSKESKLQISLDDYRASVHGEKISCQDCHIDIEDESHMSRGGAPAVWSAINAMKMKTGMAQELRV